MSNEGDGLLRMKLEVSEANHSRMQGLMAACELKSEAELFNAALSLFASCVAERQQGRQVISVDELAGDFNVLAIPALGAVQPSSRAG